MAGPECARGGGVSHFLAEKRGVSFTLFKKMHENAIFSPIRGGGGSYAGYALCWIHHWYGTTAITNILLFQCGDQTKLISTLKVLKTPTFFVNTLSSDTSTRENIFNVRQPATGLQLTQPLIHACIHIITCCTRKKKKFNNYLSTDPNKLIIVI